MTVAVAREGGALHLGAKMKTMRRTRTPVVMSSTAGVVMLRNLRVPRFASGSALA